MSFSALIPADQLQTANATLESQGYGPSNFSVPVYDGPLPNYATLHAWSDAAFQSAVEAIPNVTVSAIEGTPAERVADALSGLTDAGWGGNAPLLEGQVTKGLYRDDDGDLWYVITPFDRDVYDGPLTDYPALVIPARVPGVAAPWTQPRFAEEAYTDNDPFTGEGELVTHPDRSGNTEQPGVDWIWQCKTPANTTEPGQDGSFHRWWEPIKPLTQEN